MKQVDRSRMILAGAAALFLATAAFGQATSSNSPPAAKPSEFKNLKILPAEIPRDRLIAVMKNFSTALGVKCTFCHVGEEGKRETMDFASDANPHKAIARRMMTITRRLNEQDFAVKDFTQSKLTSYTCHRGAAEPLAAPAAPAAPTAPPPPAASERG